MRCTVGDVMTTRVVAVTEETPFAVVAGVLAEDRVLPVVDIGGRLVGVITKADLVRKDERRAGRASLRDRLLRRGDAEAAPVDARGLMSAPAVTVAPHTSIAEAARVLMAHGHRAVPVVGERGRLAGIVARGDLLRTVHTVGHDHDGTRPTAYPEA